MPRFDANLSFLFNEVPFLDRFGEAARAGFSAVEFAFGYEHPLAEIAARLGLTENAVRQAFYRFRQRYQAILREEIAHTVATPGDIEDELRHLIAVLEA